MGNPNHDEKGRFASGSSSAAASGDHQAASPSPNVRNVPGHGAVARSQVVAKHNGAPSVGTDKPRFVLTPGGLKPKQMTTGLRPAAQERAELNRRVDASHYPSRSTTERAAATDLGQPRKPARGWPYNNA